MECLARKACEMLIGRVQVLFKAEADLIFEKALMQSIVTLSGGS